MIEHLWRCDQGGPIHYKSISHIADFKTPVVNGVLMEFHTDSIPPGTYTIRLQVIDSTGNAGAEKAEVTLTIQ